MGLVVFLIAACSGDDESDGSTTTSVGDSGTITSLSPAAGDTESAPAATTTTSTTTTTTEAPELTFPEYKIISRETGDDGDVVVVLLDPTTYESLSDIDIYNVMSDLVEQFSPVYEAYIVETQAAADALFVEEPTEDEAAALSAAYIARLEEGFRIVYVGRFEDSGVELLAS